MRFQDQSQRFIFKEAPVRGEVVNLTASYQEMFKCAAYPLAVQKLLGEALVAVTLLSATIKYEGSIILQTQGDGPVSLLIAQANAMREIRGLAKWEGSVPTDFGQAVGEGHLAITIDSQKTRERYQGIVELRGGSLSHTIENYFLQSEQLPTLVFIAADQSKAVGLLLQLLPNAKQDDLIFWEEIYYLAKTLTTKELLELPKEQILHRLFHEHPLQLFDPVNIQFVCRCSRDAMAKAIITLGYEEALQLLSTQKMVSVTCEFCNKQLDFDRIDIERIFKEQPSDSGDDIILH